MKMRKGGNLFFGERHAEGDEVEDFDYMAASRQATRQPLGMANANSWATQSTSLSKVQLLGHPMVIR